MSEPAKASPSLGSDISFRLLVLFPGSKPAVAPSDGLAGMLLHSLVRLGAHAAEIPTADLLGAVAAFDSTDDTLLEPPRAWQRGRTAPWTRSLLTDFVLRLNHSNRTNRRPPPKVFVFASATYVLRGKPSLDRLLANTMHHGVAGIGNMADGVLAFAASAETITQAPLNLTLLLRALCIRTPCGAGLPALPGEGNRWEPCIVYGPDASPASRGANAKPAFAAADSPAYLNTAIAEALESPAWSGSIGSDTDLLRLALHAQRETSAVRWIYNELLNITEFRSGYSLPASTPPEIHIAISGRCNIECRFCSYTHQSAGRELVTLSQLMKLELLRDIRILRLHSGNGEPTINRELPALIDYVTHAYPQVGMNFFTNGILLDDHRLLDALVGGHVNWISVSLNAATASQWHRLCGSDQFDRVLRGVECLSAAKRASGSVTPVVYGSMVLTKESVFELPLMPALCRRIGIDRFTAIPFFSLGYEHPDRFKPEDAYHHIGAAYDPIYEETLREAERWDVSIELPPPIGEKKAAFGTETRVFRDFAQVECNGNPLELLLSTWKWPEERPCHFLWKQAAVGIAAKGQSKHPGGNFLYPCLGPLATVNFAPHTPMPFDDQESFMSIWRNPIFTRLREGQTKRGVVPVCDTCRGCDTRAPARMLPMQLMLSRFVREYGLQ